MPVKNLRQRKQELRSRYKRVREAFTPEKKASLDAQLAERFFSLPEYKEAKVIFAFVSKGIEVETGKIISGALADGKSVAVPLCDMENTEIDFYYINSRDDLTDGVFGLLEPDVSKCAKAKPDDADICIVPGLVFDREGYRLGFIQMRIDLSKKRTVEIVYELGFERMVRYAIEEFAKMGLSPTIVRAPARLVSKSENRKNGYTGAIPNMQFDYDHRNDIGLFLDDEYVSKRLRAMQEAYEEVKDLASVFAGPAVIETFGEEPFVPAKCEHAVTLSRYQQEKLAYMRNEGVKITNRYIPLDEFAEMGRGL
jgi:5,10-methenyltetrahydrofolate synthetase